MFKLSLGNFFNFIRHQPPPIVFVLTQKKGNVGLIYIKFEKEFIIQ